MKGRLAIAAVLCALTAPGCSAPEERPKEPHALREYLLRKAEQKFRHALRITERRSPDPFNQAREQVFFTLIELGEFEQAERMGRDFLAQQLGYIDAARIRLAEIQVDWRKELAANPKLEGGKREKTFQDLETEWKTRLRTAEAQYISIALLLGEMLMHLERHGDAIEIFKGLFEVHPGHNTGLRRIGQAYGLLGEHALAISYLEKAYLGIEERIHILRTREPEPDPGPRDAVESLAAAPPPDPARRIPELERGQVEIAAVIAVLYEITGDRTKADAWFAQAFSLDPVSSFVGVKQGITLFRDRDLETGCAHIDKFLASLPEGAAGLVPTLVHRLRMKYTQGK